MASSQLMARLAEEFGRDRIVAEPDHPLLLRPPDLLVAARELAAVFIPQSIEVGDPAHLGRRAAL